MVTKTKRAGRKRTAKSKTAETAAMSTCQALQITIKMGVLLALALLLLTGVWGIREYLHTTQESAEMSFTGTGEHFIANNTAKITFSFSDRQQDISSAHDAVTTQVKSAYALLTQANIADTDIQTTGYTIYPEYRRPSPESPPITREKSSDILGYRVSHTTTISIRDVEKIGTILTMISNLHPETVTGPFFSADKEDKKYAEDVATIQAIHAAKTRAYKITQLTNLHLKKITRINVYENHVRPYARLESASTTFTKTAVQQEAIPIHQGEQKIQQTAVITYEVEERKRRIKR